MGAISLVDLGIMPEDNGQNDNPTTANYISCSNCGGKINRTVGFFPKKCPYCRTPTAGMTEDSHGKETWTAHDAAAANAEATSVKRISAQPQRDGHKYSFEERQRIFKDYENYQIGIDAGSKTIKICLSDHFGQPVYSLYRRHQSDIKTTLSELLHEMTWRYGTIKGTIAVTGSAGIGIAQALNLPFVQEVVATTKIVRKEYPQADAVIELGGEDAKIIYLTDGLEQRMNSTCAGGTGGFIDTIAYMLGVTTADINGLAHSAMRIYPIASRCAVFAQTDIRPLMNAGVKTGDLAASALDAVVRQTIGGLACGRPIKGNVIFLGGPCQFLPSLVQRFRDALGLTLYSGIRPPYAQFFTARGASLYGAELPNPTVVDFRELERAVDAIDFTDSSLQRLEPLFTSEEEIAAFQERHKKATIPRKHVHYAEGPLYLGIDAGSTTIKLAVINDAGELVYRDYRENEGDMLKVAAEMLKQMWRDLPHDYYGNYFVNIAHTVATGYGEDLLKAGLGVDSGVVETTAHVQGALQMVPDASFVLDIGGQDMKAIWIKDGLVQNAVLNEACSSGCGSFISGTAYSLKLYNDDFNTFALRAKQPVDLGTKCTVFMSSRVKHAQKTGATVDDLAAGCAYSVVKNALFRIIGINNLDTLGDKIVVQGGTFMNDSILRAFEKISGKQVIRPEVANLMGALGAAFIARARAHRIGPDAQSTLIAREELDRFNPTKSAFLCEGCENQCTLSQVDFGTGRTYISGNKCGKALELYSQEQEGRSAKAPNALAAQRALMGKYDSLTTPGRRGTIRIGLMNTLLTYENTPFWHTFFHELGFSLELPHSLATFRGTRKGSAGSDTVPSESVCYPAKSSHRRLKALSEQGATYVFSPVYERGINCPVAAQYTPALQDGALLTEPLAQSMIMPTLPMASPFKFATREDAQAELKRSLDAILLHRGDALSDEEFQSALAAGLAEQERYCSLIRQANQRVLSWLQEDKSRHAVLLAGRPYHADEDIAPGIDNVLTQLELGVLAAQGISLEDEPRFWQKDSNAWNASSRMLRFAHFAAEHERVNLVMLQSFGCLYDSINVEDVRDYLEERDMPFTALKIDEIMDTAHIRIRLRTLAENVEQLELARENRPSVQAEAVSQRPALRVAAPLSADLVELALDGSIEAFGNLEPADVETARVYTRDLCFTTAALVGRSLRILDACPTMTKLVLPCACQDCVLGSVPHILEKLTGRSLTLIWVKSWPMSESATTNLASNRPLVGILGTAPLCFDAYLNDNIGALIRANGCEPLFPEADALFGEDISFRDQIAHFYSKDVRSIIYLQSFGCVKTHVQVRGALHRLEAEFPGLHITTLDYDPESSALNRENRILLTLSSVLEGE